MDPQTRRCRGLSLWRQCLCVVLAYTMLINPAWLLQATQAGDVWGNLAVIRDNVKQYKLASQADFNPTTDIVRTYARQTTFAYNEMYQQISRTLPDGRSEYKSYDSDGRLIKAVDFAGQVTAYLYEDVNAPSAVSAEKYYGDEGRYIADEPNLVESFTYDRLGRKITSEVNDLDADTLAVYKNYYDSQGRLYGLASPQGYIRYTFSDISNRQLDVVTPEASIEDQSFYDKVEYSYDQLGRLDTVTVRQRNSQPVNESTVYSYSPVGSLATVDYPNGNTASYTYDNLNRLTRLEHRDTNRIIASYDYTLGSDGIRKTAREITYNGSSYDTTNINWSYDSLNRLVSEDFNAPGDINDFTHGYTYDTVGNILEKQSAGEDSKSYYYDPNNDQLERIRVGDVNTFYYYNANGSLIEESNDVSLIRQYSYNLQGRLSSVDNATASVQYTYNPDGFRVKASVSSGPAIEYLPDPFNQTGYTQIFKSKPSSGDSTVYVAGLDIISQAEGTSDPLYFIYDGHGSTRHLADATGVITESFDYDAYGNSRFDPSAVSTSLLYSGEWYDSSAAQYYLRARWYNPQTQRFNRMDTYAGSPEDPQSLHRYLYCYGDPVHNIDPSGEFTLTGLCISMAIGAIIGATIGGIIAHHVGAGIWKGILIGAGIGAATGALVYLLWSFGAAVRSGALKRFFYDSRTFTTISRQYWQKFGPASGRSLHHWLIPQRWTWISEGVRNAGFNLLRLPKLLPGSLGLNQWIGFALRWGGTRTVVAVLVENGIRVIIPITALASYHAGKWLGNEIAEKAIQLEGGTSATPIKLNKVEEMEMQEDAGKALLEELE
jgi:RHS repeat-associated protein